MAQRILVVDDDKQLVRLVQSYLEQAGMTTYVAYDGEEAMRMIRTERPDLVVLDLMLPKRDGWEITRTLRGDERLAMIPILILTARMDDSDKILGLELGGDDYLTKPFNPLEVMSRVRAILRRANGNFSAPHILEIGGLRLDVGYPSVCRKRRTPARNPTRFALRPPPLRRPHPTLPPPTP